MRRIGLSVSLAALMAVSLVSGADARGPARAEASGPTSVVTPAASYTWSLTNVVCYTEGGQYGFGGITATAKIRENGVSGTTWLKMTAKYQRFYGGAWHTTRSTHRQSSYQFPNDSDWHSITYHIGFNAQYADITHDTRVFVRYEWFSNNTRIYWATRWSGSC
jgi:hypothetical protein